MPNTRSASDAAYEGNVRRTSDITGAHCRNDTQREAGKLINSEQVEGGLGENKRLIWINSGRTEVSDSESKQRAYSGLVDAWAWKIALR